MEFITKNDLLKIGECAGQDIEVHKHAELSVIYHKLEFLCKKIKKRDIDLKYAKIQESKLVLEDLYFKIISGQKFTLKSYSMLVQGNLHI